MDDASSGHARVAPSDSSLFPSEPTTRSVLIANERTKLTATYVYAIAGSIFTVGGLAQILAVLDTSSPPGLPAPAIVGIAEIGWVTGGTLHDAARRSRKERHG